MNAVATQRMTMRHWGVLATCVFCTFGCAAVAFSVPGLCYRPVSQYLGVDVFDVSLYMTIVYLTEVVLSAPVGRLLQRFDMRIVCTAAACSTSLGFAAMSFYTELWQWYLSGVLIGFGEITLLWLMVASLLNRWFSKRLGLVIGLSYAMTGVGAPCSTWWGSSCWARTSPDGARCTSCSASWPSRCPSRSRCSPSDRIRRTSG